MRVAIPTDGDYVSAHFGRCPIFTLVDLENNKEVKRVIIENPGHAPGLVPKLLHEKNVEVIICGGMGAKAVSLIQEYKMQAISGVSGKIDEVIAKFEKGVLESGESMCTPGAGRGYGIEKNECDHGHEKENCEHDHDHE
ncbi:Dinitrogenase iron-molybdenum cofactor biosynthesis [Desulforamulus reducens MI-1]|uniref:Dinitrogenase iron-molybdenum cofactor biosynthesis n=1 Tax=Desulforamulus reducens (strain ATCC BAA-1160 / DSM 100696 / MI-1) TaxID=349161 RepID=A4J6N0_DESRM|nr:NifB/NifX family molybdenum-iron cluster-binding protein [Desulforamulus reducens]ABO50733.1 Dinitrogenase iron-molybdenum cofactor biosynthesis [Desulforamulus reducens MI-1]